MGCPRILVRKVGVDKTDEDTNPVYKGDGRHQPRDAEFRAYYELEASRLYRLACSLPATAPKQRSSPRRLCFAPMRHGRASARTILVPT